MGEGKARYQLARRLLGLRRYEEARPEIERVIESDKRYGHTAAPWKTWATLNDLERATGHIQEAQAARSQAIATYLAYRRDGGDSQSNQIQYFSLVAKAVLENTQEQAALAVERAPGAQRTACVHVAYSAPPVRSCRGARSCPCRRSRAGLSGRRRAAAPARHTQPGKSRPDVARRQGSEPPLPSRFSKTGFCRSTEFC